MVVANLLNIDFSRAELQFEQLPCQYNIFRLFGQITPVGAACSSSTWRTRSNASAFRLQLYVGIRQRRRGNLGF